MAMTGQSLLNRFGSKKIDGSKYKKDGGEINISELFEDNAIFQELCNSIVEEIQENAEVNFSATQVLAQIKAPPGGGAISGALLNGKIDRIEPQPTTTTNS